MFYSLKSVHNMHVLVAFWIFAVLSINCNVTVSRYCEAKIQIHLNRILQKHISFNHTNYFI